MPVPEVCTQLLRELEGPPSRAQCVWEAQHAVAVLAAESMEVPEWSKFLDPHFREPQHIDQVVFLKAKRCARFG